MNEEGQAADSAQRTVPTQKLILVCVGSESLHDLDLSVHIEPLVEDTDWILPFLDQPTEGVPGLVAHKENRGFWVGDIVFKVMFHSPRRTHPGG